MLAFRNVSIFPDQEYGFRYLNFDTQGKKKYAFVCHDDEQVKILSWLLEGKIKPEHGYIIKHDHKLIQNDRWWVHFDKISYKNVSIWLRMNDRANINFENKRHSKFACIEKMQARSILNMPIYRLRGIDRIKFALLSLTFQSTGAIILASLPQLQLEQPLLDFYQHLLCLEERVVFMIVTENDVNKIPDHFKTVNLIKEKIL